MNSIFKYFSDIFRAVISLLKGMRVTAGYFFSPRQIVTQQYPENRKTLEMFDRYKGEVIMPHNDQNQHRCTGCAICETNCPNGSIEIIQAKVDMPDGKKKRIIDKHIYHLSMCTFCGLCIKSCPSNALAWGQEFEHAVFDRTKLTKILNQPGSSIIKDIAE
ncbi:MAG: 4Fe-4S binding protein [Bacteroidales bacterium]|nr:4Fe-4S binding protein [Bacteroidales bacterium]HNW72336.1 4Fe-4S binding protein [Bacteroidales bacterium]HPS49595.1 4Fe-4S binding protein [Bacteroidales bacterium]